MSNSVADTNLNPHAPSASTPAQFFRLRASGIAREREDEFTDICFAMGAEGVAEDLPFEQKDLCYDPDVVETPILDVSVFFAKAPGESALLKLQSDFPEAELKLVTEQNKDWLAEWKKGFKPFLFAGDFWIVPSWCEIPPEAGTNPSRVLLVEPGMAFGTGTHETTRLAAGYTIETCEAVNPKTLLDVGCGTGVLALVAHRLGVENVIGIDNDLEARRTARENMELNRDTSVEIPDANIEDIHTQFDVVIANIIDGVLTRIQHELSRVLKPGGRMILSGVLVEREKEFYANFCAATGLKLLKSKSDGEWSAAVLEKASGANQ